MMERLKMWLYIRLNSRCNGTKKIIKLVGNVIRVSKVFTLIVNDYFWRFWSFNVWGNYWFNSFLCVFDIINVVFRNNYLITFFLFFSKVDKLFLYVLYSWCKIFLLLETHLIYILKSLFFFSIAFFISLVIHGFCLKFLCFFVEFFFHGAWELIKLFTVFR